MEPTKAETTTQRDMSFTQNRELSWLEFNRRVLEEGCDERTPLFERLKFISIFTSNLDEFFMVRVGSLANIAAVKKEAKDNKTGWTAREQLDHIFEAMPKMYEERDEALFTLEPLLAQKGIQRKQMGNLSKKEANEVEEFYYDRVFPVLSPLVIDTRHPFPHLSNQQLYIFSDITDEMNTPFFGIVAIPPILDPVLSLSSGAYILLEDIVLEKMADLFQGFTINDKAVISITRNADINLDEEVDDMDENIRQAIKKSLRKRNRMAAVRLEVQGELTKASVKFLLKHHELDRAQLYYSKAPLRMKYVFMLEDRLSAQQKNIVSYRPFSPQPSPGFDMSRSVTDQIFEEDKLLHYPYEQMDPFLQMLKEASQDPAVISIRITIYRMASVSKVAEYLAQAAENGKEVLALMELRARFDEENNIDYSERLEEAGCTVIYGFEDFKVHSKICLITMYRNDKIQTITQIGTGNYNEKTAKQYTDLAFFTAREEIGQDATAFFKNMLINNLEGNYRHLLVAPVGIKPALMNLFDREIRRAKEGKEARVIIKCNSISERDLIDKMQKASEAGVAITLIVRGICCIRPGVPGKTENIRVISVVGRFLEHHRIYAFGAQYDDLYVSSADLMTRNIVNRVEIAAPVRSENVRKRIIHILEVFLQDDKKAKELLPDGTYIPVTDGGQLSAQTIFMSQAEQSARKKTYSKELKEKISTGYRRMGEEPIKEKEVQVPEEKPKTLWERIVAFFKGE